MVPRKEIQEQTDQVNIIQKNLENITTERDKYVEDLKNLQRVLFGSAHLVDSWLFGGAFRGLIDNLERAVNEANNNVQGADDRIKKNQEQLEQKRQNIEQGIKEQENSIQDLEELIPNLNTPEIKSQFEEQLQTQKGYLQEGIDFLEQVTNLINAAGNVLEAGLQVVGNIFNRIKTYL
jgi:chromosome segregation ATPase